MRIRFLKTDQRKNRVVWQLESNNILYCNDATASPKRLQTAKIQIPGEDRFAAMGLTIQMHQLNAYRENRSTWQIKDEVLG